MQTNVPFTFFYKIKLFIQLYSKLSLPIYMFEDTWFAQVRNHPDGLSGQVEFHKRAHTKNPSNDLVCVRSQKKSLPSVKSKILNKPENLDGSR